MADKAKRSEKQGQTKHPQGDSFENRLDKLGGRLGKFRRQNQDRQAPNRRGTAMGLAFRLVSELVAGLVVGGFLGWWIDKWLGTMPLFLLIFFALGAAAGILNVIRTAKAMQKDMNDGDEGGK